MGTYLEIDKSFDSHGNQCVPMVEEYLSSYIWQYFRLRHAFEENNTALK